MASIVVFRVALDQYDARPRFKANAAVIASLLDTQTAGVAKRIAGSWGLSDRTGGVGRPDSGGGGRRQTYPDGSGARIRPTGQRLAVPYMSKALDDVTAQVSLPVAGMPATTTCSWSRLTAPQDFEVARKKPLRAAAR